MKSVPPAAASKTPGRSATEPGVRAADGPEERGLQQRLGHGRAVERDERALPPREGVQDLADEEVLARAGRARHEERQRRRRERRDAAPQLAHRGPRPQKKRPVDSGASRSARTRLHDADEALARRLVLAHRVRERVRAQAARLVLERDVLVRRREDDGQVGRAAAQPLEDVEALAVPPLAALAPARRRLAERPAVRKELLVGDLEPQVEDDGVRAGARSRASAASASVQLAANGSPLGRPREDEIRRELPEQLRRARLVVDDEETRAALHAPLPRRPNGRTISGPSSTATRR